MPHLPEDPRGAFTRVIKLDVFEKPRLDSAQLFLEFDDSSRLAIVVGFRVVHGKDANSILSWRGHVRHPNLGQQGGVPTDNHFLNLDGPNPNSFDKILHVLIELEVVVDKDPKIFAFFDRCNPVSAKPERGSADGVVASVEHLMVRFIFIDLEAFRPHPSVEMLNIFLEVFDIFHCFTGFVQFDVVAEEAVVAVEAVSDALDHAAKLMATGAAALGDSTGKIYRL